MTQRWPEAEHDEGGLVTLRGSVDHLASFLYLTRLQWQDEWIHSHDVPGRVRSSIGLDPIDGYREKNCGALSTQRLWTDEDE
jgi:hypothetical protein